MGQEISHLPFYRPYELAWTVRKITTFPKAIERVACCEHGPPTMNRAQLFTGTPQSPLCYGAADFCETSAPET